MNGTKFYQLRKGFAKHNNLLVYFAAKTLAETPKALYLYGHGTTESARMGICMCCGRTLTHPVSVELGIGPVCGAHFHNWDLIGGYTKENLERLKGALKDVVVDHWVPRSQIVNVRDIDEDINVPENHPIIQHTEATKSALPPIRWAGIGDTAYGHPSINVTFPFNMLDLSRIKELPGRKWDPARKLWILPMIAENIDKLVEWGFKLGPKLQIEYDKMSVDKVSSSQVKAVDVTGLKRTLYPFQSKGVAFIEAKRGRALVADEMGLGKTVQALAWLQLHPEYRPAVIVVPASLKLNWAREIESWIDFKTIQILSGTTVTHLFGDIVIINYDILPDWVEALVAYHPKVLIADECHYFKNNKAKRTKAVKQLGKDIPHVICLSGTPIVNRPVEVFNAIKLINPSVVSSFWTYAMRYCGARNNGFGWDFSGATNTQELHDKLTNTIMIRRLKRDVLMDLPDKTRSIIPIELSNKTDYDAAEDNFIEFVRQFRGEVAAHKASNAQALTEIEGLKQLAVRGKMAQAITWIEDFLEEDGKLVVFANHTFVIDALMEHFKDVAVKIDGSVSTEHRQRAVDAFQTNDRVRLFVGNIKAAGVGITLTAASNVAFLELPWTPGDLTQAEDRCHRIGQRDSVNIHYLLAANTIEEKIATLIDKKRKVLDSVLDGTVTDVESLLTELIKTYE